MDGQPAAVERRLDHWVVGLAGLVALLWYGTALPARISFGGDCGELAAAAWSLGVPHPTGYPLWIWLARAAGLVPFGTVAWRLAAWSALCAGLLVAVVTGGVLRATGDRVAGLVAGLTLLACGTVGAQATIVEVYSLQLLLLGLLLLAHQGWVRTADQRWLALLGLGYGLALTCHVSVVLFVPGSLAMLWRTCRGGPVRPLAAAGRVALWALPPLVLYLLLPLRAHFAPAINTGATDTLRGLVDHLTGRIYRGNFGHLGAAEFGRYVRNHLYYLAADLGWAVVLVGLGAWNLWRQARPLALVLLPGAVLALLFAGLYRVGDRANYVLPTYLVAALLAGSGAAWLRRALWPGEAREAREAVTGRWVVATILLLLPLLPSWPGWLASLEVARARTSLRGNDRAPQLLDALLDAAPPGAALLVLSDEVAYGLWYEQIVEGRRRDLLVGGLGSLESPEGWARCVRAVRRQAAVRPVAVAFWDPRLTSLGRWTWEGPIGRLQSPDELPEVRLGGARTGPAQPAPECPAAPGWRLSRATVWSAVTEGREPAARRQLLKPRTLGAVVAEWQAGPPGDYEAVVACFHRSEAARFDPQWASTPLRIVNDSSGQPVTWTVLQLPFGPLAGGYRLAAHRRLEEHYPLALPTRSLPGTWLVRVGLLPRGQQLTAELAWQATLPAGQIETFER